MPVRPAPLLASITAALAAAGLIAVACDPAPPTTPPQPTAAPIASLAPTASATPTASAASPEPSASAVASADPYPPPPPPDPPIQVKGGGKNAARGALGMVTTVEPNATRIGVDVIKKGGNAIDAAVAVAYALAVTHPSAGNIGGGGFMIVRLQTGEVHAVDFREIAPANVTTAKVLKEIADGAEGYPSIAVPGTIAGMSFALEKFGTRPLAELIAPAVELAKSHKLGPRQALALSWAWKKLKKDPAARTIWGGKGDGPAEQGARIRQPDLARSLELIAKEGPKVFYEGAIADAIEKAMKKNGGYVTKADLAAYKPKLRAPLRFSYRGFTVDTMPPPSMGGVAFAEIMSTLERLHAEKAPADSGESLHLFVEAARRAYVDRRQVGADPDFQSTDLLAQVKVLLSGAHLETRKPPIDRDKATLSTDIPNGPAAAPESPQTTHFSIADGKGNAVSCTYTLSAGFGSKVIIPGTGILFANSLGAFSEKGVNTVAQGKRPASSMTPTIVTQGGALRLVLGSPGGDTIPNTVAQVLRNVVDHGMTIDEAAAHGRVHHQYLPDQIRVERLNQPPKAALADLEKRGHALRLDNIPLGHANVILADQEGTLWGYADLREGGKALGLDPPAATKADGKGQ